MSRRTVFKFCLYVAGDAQNSTLAVANFMALCLTYIPDRHELEVVDVFHQPERALAEGIFMTPTLVAITPAPSRKIVGTLSDTKTVLMALGLSAQTA